MNTFTKSKSIKVKISLIALAANFLAILSYGQEPAGQLQHDAKATFGIVSDPKQEELDKPIVELGRHLFWDERLSANGKIACASCHAARSWGADTRRFSLDAKGKLTKRNSQTVFNSMLQPHLRWTGDRKSGAHQARNRSPVRWDSQMLMMLRYCSNNTAMSPCFSVRFHRFPIRWLL